jgi:hypothetical protein
MSAPEAPLTCGTHGKAWPAYVCEHLAHNPVQRWVCAYPSRSDPWPDAWCARCDRRSVRDRRRVDSSGAGLRARLLCHHCYADARARALGRLKGRALVSWRAFVRRCRRRLHERQDRLQAEFELGRHKRWDWDQRTGELVFSGDGAPAVRARVHFVGSVSTVSGTWLWSWANFSLARKVRRLAGSVREFGERKDYPHLTTPRWPATEADGWDMAAVAAELLDADGVYRTPGETGFLFMVLTRVRRARPPRAAAGRDRRTRTRAPR